eukprot:CAMPEP_0206175882 /NCGR_PEP_ID=MMETSP1474-20131121/56454_1 /ASSEMBLY_ACC=CAM_ASM_001110 /TAXON_ID=97495 /ORGANISM="Imantonia sp., Strain RCC918" /LENGTH=105 /DNA_ID=CAMNT_0053586497 /DNA_START=22 /DNA_END=336 /DNA_ORIENTATION=+
MDMVSMINVHVMCMRCTCAASLHEHCRCTSRSRPANEGSRHRASPGHRYVERSELVLAAAHLRGARFVAARKVAPLASLRLEDRLLHRLVVPRDGLEGAVGIRPR